ncbi:hypothetical protein EZS27_026378 [termite gut metagenome]|uniref:Primase C-terminal 1 domain-containing protein n=1 Tax=termite gut metagenome TaxID=433724 RepID=A0A5J4QT25_9ZZZZ
MDRLADFSKDNNVLVLLVAHTTKMTLIKDTNDYQIPDGYSINGSAHFKGKADYIIVVHKKVGINETIIKVDKVRYKNYGSTGEITLDYDMPSGNYKEMTFEAYLFGENKPYQQPPTTPQLFVIPSQNETTPDYLDVEVDYFDNKMDVEPKAINLKQFITSMEYKKVVEYIRAGSSEEETKTRKNKANLPCVCISGRFNTHRSTTDLKEPTGLICIDIDLEKNEVIMPKVPTILKSISNVAFYAKSVRGIGYYAIIPIHYGNKLLNHFFALERDFKNLGITIDKACKDYTRLRLASYDTEYWINTGIVDVYSKTLECEYKETEPTPEPKKQKNYSNGNDFETVENILNDCISNNVVLTNDYGDWYKLALSLISVFQKTDIEKSREYFHKFAKLSNKYNETKSNENFDKLLENYKDNNKITIKSLVYLYDKYFSNKE